MSFSFATCNRKSALGFIRQVFPDRDLQDEGVVAECLDVVEADIVRIQDPMMHGSRIAVLPSKNWDSARQTEIVGLFRRLQEGEPVSHS